MEPSPEGFGAGIPGSALDGRALRVGFAQSAVSHLAPQDAQIAIRVLFRQVAADGQLSLEPRVYADDGLLMSDVRQGRLDVFLVPGATYSRLSREVDLVPLLVPSGDQSGADSLLLLTSQGRKVADIQNGRLVIDSGGWGEMPQIWLDEKLRSLRLPPASAHFAQVDTVHHALRAILRVFYGKADGCVVSRQAFNEAQRRNSQLNERLQVQEMSQPLMQQVVGITGALHRRRSYLADIIVKQAQESVRGSTMKQLLVGDDGRLITFQEAMARETMALVATSDSAAWGERVAQGKEMSFCGPLLNPSSKRDAFAPASVSLSTPVTSPKAAPMVPQPSTRRKNGSRNP